MPVNTTKPALMLRFSDQPLQHLQAKRYAPFQIFQNDVSLTQRLLTIYTTLYYEIINYKLSIIVTFKKISTNLKNEIILSVVFLDDSY